MKFHYLKTKKISALALATIMVGSVSLSACSEGSKDSTKSSSEVTTTLENATSATEEPSVTTTEATAEATTKATTEATIEATTETESATTASDWHDVVQYEEIELDGDKDHYVETTDFCYIESEKYVLFFEKDMKIPGDFVTNLDAIVDEIERQLGIVACPEGADYGEVMNKKLYYGGYNPWENCNIGNKIQIFFAVDRKPEGWISCATSEGATFVEYELYSDEAWNLIYPSDEDAWRRRDYIDYSIFVHELTHSITLRHSNLSKILCEGIAEYMGYSVIQSLADQYPSIGVIYESESYFDYSIPEAINADNAERIFLEDFNQIKHANRGAEYTVGKYFYKFLHEKYGADFYADLSQAISKKNLQDAYQEYDENLEKQYVSVCKEVFGENVFTEFGNWCVENNFLQEVY